MVDSHKIAQVRSARQVPVYVRLLDDELFQIGIDKRAVGWILFNQVCDHLNLLEKDYFGLNYRDPAGVKYWLNNDKKISKQLKAQKWELSFEVKFYPPDPAQLAEDLTRYQLCLQIRRDIVNEKLPCSFVTYTLLGSYTAQSELGDYDTEEFGSGYKYLKDIQFAPHQDKELLMKISELHRQHKGQTPEEAELHFLENAQKLAMYGVELHQAMDAEGKEISLGVCASGLIVYKDKQQINRFVWPKVLKISYRRNKYYIKIRPGEFEEFASLIGFRVANVKLAKRLWKISVEHHSFFRFREPEPVKSVSILPRFGSRFRYSGRTQYQTRQVVAEENRDAPNFDRVMSKRGTFGGRTTAMRKRDEERQQRREEQRRQPLSPQNNNMGQTKPPAHRPPPAPEPRHTPPEPRHPPPIAPKPKPRGSMDSIDKIDHNPESLNNSFDEHPDRRSKMEKMHAVATPLAAVLNKQVEQRKKPESDSSSRGPPGYSSDDPEDRHEEPESRPLTPEVIDQHIPAVEDQPPPMTEKERKLFAKQEKERIKREKEEEKRRKKEEEKERKRLEKEKKAVLAKEKDAAKKKSKQKGKRESSLERRDSKGSGDIGRDWDDARALDTRESVTPERSRKRLSSFEDIKREADREAEEDRPPTPPEPLPVTKGMRKVTNDHSDSSEYDSSEDRHQGPGQLDDEEDGEEVSF